MLSIKYLRIIYYSLFNKALHIFLISDYLTMLFPENI